MQKFVLFGLLLFSSQVWALKSSEVLIEAQSAFARGDLFNSIRYYTLAIDKTPDALDVKDVENFLLSQYIMTPQKKFIETCRERTSSKVLQVEFNFYCAKVLIYNEQFLEASYFIDNVPKEYQRLEYYLLKSTLFLNLNRSNQCLENISDAGKLITDKTSQHFQDLLKVLNARCFVSRDRFEQAIPLYQSISIGSEFYLSTLEEQAWVQFKSRNLVASRDILKILISYFTSQNPQNQIFGADLYFRARYLQAYIELVSQNREKARDMFTALKNEIGRFKNLNLKKMSLPKDLNKKLLELDSMSKLVKQEYHYISELRRFIKNWNTTTDLKYLDNHIRSLIAANKEISTIKTLGNNYLDYQKNVRRLRDAEVTWIKDAISLYIKKSQRTFESLEFKAKMGQVENFWTERTEGKRTLADVLETYKNEVNYLEDRMGN